MVPKWSDFGAAPESRLFEIDTNNRSTYREDQIFEQVIWKKQLVCILCTLLNTRGRTWSDPASHSGEEKITQSNRHITPHTLDL
jgi:hypothetical protein